MYLATSHSRALSSLVGGFFLRRFRSFLVISTSFVKGFRNKKKHYQSVRPLKYILNCGNDFIDFIITKKKILSRGV